MLVGLREWRALSSDPRVSHPFCRLTLVQIPCLDLPSWQVGSEWSEIGRDIQKSLSGCLSIPLPPTAPQISTALDLQPQLSFHTLHHDLTQTFPSAWCTSYPLSPAEIFRALGCFLLMMWLTLVHTLVYGLNCFSTSVLCCTLLLWCIVQSYFIIDVLCPHRVPPDMIGWG